MPDRWPLKAAMVYTHRPIGSTGRCLLCGRLTISHGTWWERALWRWRSRRTR